MEQEKEFKKQLCPEFEQGGTCSHGNDCGWAHGIKELRTELNPLYKSQICTAFQQVGECQMGDCCLFAHGEHELRQEDVTPTTSYVANSPYPAAQPKSSARHSAFPETTAQPYKVALCMYFSKGKVCPNGAGCTFAHGESELRSTAQKTDPSDPKYKTKLCIRFEKDQFCASGDNCMFAHGEDELRGAMIPEKKNKPGLYKSMLCNNFNTLGVCPNGKNCSFAHGRYELRPMHFDGDFEKKIAENPRWKCSMCKIFEANGHCARQDCDFAHGLQELRAASRDESPLKSAPTNFKTVLCTHFMQNGSCTREAACSFAHGEHELRRVGNPIKMSAGHVSQPAMAAHTEKPQNYKTVLCDRWKKTGQCQYQNKCNFAHGPQELRPAGASPRSNALKRPAESDLHSAFYQMPVASIPEMQPPSQSVPSDLRLFEEFLEFKKFKESKQGVDEQQISSPPPTIARRQAPPDTTYATSSSYDSYGYTEPYSYPQPPHYGQAQQYKMPGGYPSR